MLGRKSRGADGTTCALWRPVSAGPCLCARTVRVLGPRLRCRGPIRLDRAKENPMREMDFLRGRPAANLARFALPALGANLLQSADQVVDMLVVGAFVGERGLAALANATMVGFVANSLSLGLSVGATVLVSRRLGAGDPPRRLPCGGDGAPRGNRALGRRRAALRGPRRPALRRTRRPGRRARGRRGVHACLGGGAARRLPALRRRRRHARPRRRPHPDVARRRRRRGELRGRRRARARARRRRHGVVLDGGLLARRGALPGGARRDVFCQQDLSGNRIGN